jgi:hypothetical protein
MALFDGSLVPLIGRLNHSLLCPGCDFGPEYCGFDKVDFEKLDEDTPGIITEDYLTLFARKCI